MGKIEEYRDLKERFEKRKNQLNRADAALEAANGALKELLIEAKNKYGVSTYKKLVELKEGLEKEVEEVLSDIRSKLESAGGEDAV